jgi:hypothetical protein
MGTKNKGEDVTPEVAEKVTEYVYTNYKAYKDKPLFIKDKGSHFTILRNINEGPLLLNKKII